MNHDDHKPDLSTLIDPELEARIVAWVAGEASPFEAAELTRLTAEKPELAIFKRRIEAVSGLVGEAIHPDPEPLHLSPERRTKLLQALGAPEFKPNSARATNTVVVPMAAANKKQRRNRQWLLALAACLTMGLFTTVLFKELGGAHSMMEKKMKIADSPMELMRMELPVAEKENLERRAQADAEKRSEIAYQPAFRGDKHVYGAIRFDPTNVKTGRQIAMAPPPGSPTEPARPADFADFATRDSLGGTSARLEATKQQALSQVVQKKAEQNAQVIAEARSRLATFAAPLADYSSAAGAVMHISEPPNNAPSLADGWAAQPAAGGKKFAANEEQIVLSPFAVEAKGDVGYAASNTLGGKRINTQLRDAGSPATIVTRDSLKDIGATDSITPLQYAAYGKVNPKLGKESILAEEKAKEGVDADPAPATRPVQPPAQTFSEINASKEPVSTFSLHVSDVSFRLAQAALAKGEELDRASIRPEEFYNAFSYGDPAPTLAEKVSCRIEQSAHPFAQQRNLVRIAVKVAASGRDAAQPLHLTVLLDTSGSMEREDRAATIQSATKALTSLLGPNDRLTLIGFSRQPRLLAEALTGDQTAQVLDLIKSTPAEGGTNLEEALKLGSELAHRQFDATAQNRIVLLTDGAANLGNANPAQLAATIEALRQQGIAFDACGVGLEGLDDGMLENLTRKGDGRYYVLNSPDAADAGFAKQLAGAFRPAAENVKLQVRFNPARVGNYRLIGFEQHRLREEDFRNDKIDAAELAAEEAAVAVYQVEALPQGEGELGEVYVRFRDASSGNMVERNWTLNYDPQTPAFDRATPSIQLAGTAALLAEKLQGGEAAAAINLGELAPVVAKLRSHYANEPRVQELVTMFEQARKMAGE